MPDHQHLRAVAGLFDYPDQAYREGAHQALTAVAGRYPDAEQALERFVTLIPGDDVMAMQELYVRTFDVQAITTLDLGYVLFGDDYKRGELLANLNREHISHGNDCGHELADHLPNVLRLIPLLDGELAAELVSEIVAPALTRMIAEFDPGRLHEKEDSYRKQYKVLIERPCSDDRRATSYRFALQAAHAVLKADFGIVERIPLVEASDFLESLRRENRIEDDARMFY